LEALDDHANRPYGVGLAAGQTLRSRPKPELAGEKGQIIEENLFYDLVSFMKQIGLG